jgi:phosphoribosylanthranilate isomerase
MKIKICGITCVDDALAAVDVGADLLGFNFFLKSPRFIEPIIAARVIGELHNRGMSIDTVGVFVNASLDMITSISDDCGIDLVQLSGDEPPATLGTLRQPAFKAIRPKDTEDLIKSIQEYPPCARNPAYLVDAYRPGVYGGTGIIADWSLASKLAASQAILLAGGLTSDNVAEAVRQVHPWGVDVASGVEAAPGRKDRGKLEAFVKAARSVPR